MRSTPKFVPILNVNYFLFFHYNYKFSKIPEKNFKKNFVASVKIYFEISPVATNTLEGKLIWHFFIDII